MPQNPSNLNSLNPAGKLAAQQVDSQGTELVTFGGKSAAYLTATGAVKASAGRLCKVIVTTALSAAAITIYDNATAATGNVLAVIPASTAAGTIYDFQIVAANGIYASFGGTGTIAVTYS